MQKIKLPTTDSGAFDTALERIQNNSPLYNKETETLYIKYNDDAVPIGSNLSYTKGLTALYFCGKFNLITEWPKFGHSAVIYLTQEVEIEKDLKHPGFWVNLGDEDEPNWMPFCDQQSSDTSHRIEVGTILKFALQDDFIPEGFLKCNGQELRKNDYYELFEVIHNTYGFGTVPSQSNFNLPLIEDGVFTYLIKCKNTEFDDLVGFVFDYAGVEVPDNFVDYNTPISTFTNFELFLKIDHDSVRSSENSFEFLKKYESGQFKTIIKVYNSAKLPTGLILNLPATLIPEGYLKCDGSIIPKINYKDLFKVIGTQYGETAAYINLPTYQTSDNYIVPVIKTGQVENNIISF